jgi:hypothetical protein
MKRFLILVLVLGMLLVTKMAWASFSEFKWDDKARFDRDFRHDDRSWFGDFDRSWFGNSKHHDEHQGWHKDNHHKTCPIVPEPLSCVLFLLGAGAFVGGNKLRKKTRAA